jgi:predicted enzyme related to lactoylglutathione lyase
MAKHGICHVEWRSTDFERTKRFYGGLFDWKFEDWGDGSYMLFMPPDSSVGGGFEKAATVADSASPVVYVQVDEIEPYLSRAVELDGSVAVSRSEIPTVGWFAVLKDPDGNRIGLFQSAHQH